MRILTIGDNCVDIYADERIAFPGGGCVNVAVFTSRLGANVSYIGAIGKDKPGRFIISALENENVDIENLQYFSGNTALAFVKHIDLERVFLGSDRGVRYQLDTNRINLEIIDDYQLIHTTLDGQVDGLIKQWKEMGKVVSYDFSYRALPEQIKLLKYVDYAFFSGGDQASKSDLVDMIKEYKELGAKIVIITRGKNGSLVYDGIRIYEQKAIKTKAFDTLACGDAFISAFLVSQLNNDSIKEGLEKATTSASKALLIKGAFGYQKDVNELGIEIDKYVMYEKPRR